MAYANYLELQSNIVRSQAGEEKEIGAAAERPAAPRRVLSAPPVPNNTPQNSTIQEAAVSKEKAAIKT